MTARVTMRTALTDVNGAGVKKAILSFKGHIPLTTANLSCPGAAPYPSMCNTKSVYYENKDGVPTLNDILTR